MNFKDLLMFPKSFFVKITERKTTLFTGIIFVGLYDFFSPKLAADLWSLLTGKTSNYSTEGFLLLLLTAAVAGAIDIFVFSKPMFDLLKHFKKEPDVPQNNSLIRIMKIYISAHLLTVPFGILMSYLLPLDTAPQDSLIQILVYVDMIFRIWFSAIITRGLNTVYNFKPSFKPLVFFPVFLWNFVWGMVFSIGIGSWIDVVKKIM